MHLQVYKEPLCRCYYATPCSFAIIYWIGSLVTLLLAPFMMAYDPYKFWSKTDTYLEQPEVTYTKHLLLLAEGFKRGETFSKSFSTVAGINDFSHVGLHAAVVKLPLGSDEEIASIKMLAFFRTRLRDRARVEMDSLAYFEKGGALAGGSLYMEGDLRLRQTWPLSVYGGYSYPYLDDPLLNPDTLTSARETLFSALLVKNAARNITLNFEPRYALWERAPPYATLGGGGFGASNRVFNITAVIRIHQQSILYIPPVSEVLQAGWSKYVVMLVIVLFLVNALSGFIFRHQVVETKMVAPYAGIAAAGRTTSIFSR